MRTINDLPQQSDHAPEKGMNAPTLTALMTRMVAILALMGVTSVAAAKELKDYRPDLSSRNAIKAMLDKAGSEDKAKIQKWLETFDGCARKAPRAGEDIPEAAFEKQCGPAALPAKPAVGKATPPPEKKQAPPPPKKQLPEKPAPVKKPATVTPEAPPAPPAAPAPAPVLKPEQPATPTPVQAPAQEAPVTPQPQAASTDIPLPSVVHPDTSTAVAIPPGSPTATSAAQSQTAETPKKNPLENWWKWLLGALGGLGILGGGYLGLNRRQKKLILKLQQQGKRIREKLEEEGYVMEDDEELLEALNVYPTLTEEEMIQMGLFQDANILRNADAYVEALKTRNVLLRHLTRKREESET